MFKNSTNIPIFPWDIPLKMDCFVSWWLGGMLVFQTLFNNNSLIKPLIILRQSSGLTVQSHHNITLGSNWLPDNVENFILKRNLPKYCSCYIIDDDVVITLLHTMVFWKTDIAAEIRTFRNPSLALEQIRKDFIKQQKNILVLLNVNRPEMSGFEFLKSIRRFQNSDGKMDILMVSSSIDPDEYKKGMRHSLVRKNIAKPLKGKDLIDFIASHKTISA